MKASLNVKQTFKDVFLFVVYLRNGMIITEV